MISLSLFNIIRQKTNQPFTNKTFNAYYCGCGLIFQDPQQFKQHVLVMHDGVFVPQSSHFLAFLSKAVLPCKLWDPSVINKQEDKHQGHSAQRENIGSMSTDKNTSHKRAKTQAPHNQVRKNDQNEQGRQKKQKQEKENQNLNLAQKTAQKSQKNIICNGFVLQANKRTKLSSFYCGQCKIAFENAQDFLDHCFEACQQLQHPKSSHHIKQAQDKEIELPQGSQIKTVNQLKIRLSSVPGMIQVGVKNRQHFIQIPSTMVRIFDLVRCSGANQRIKQSYFHCGCGFQFKHNKQLINRQFLQIHHIFYCEEARNWLLCTVYLILKTVMAGAVLAKSAFVKHVQQKHKGITPVYDFPTWKDIKQ